MRSLIILFAILWCHAACGQHPAYEWLGSEELSDVDIYDLIQDENQHYILATDKGAYRYDGYRFLKLRQPNQSIGASLFRLRINGQGEVFCHNLYGQFFAVGDSALDLFYTLPDSLGRSFVRYEINREDELVIAGRKTLWVDRDGREVFRKDLEIYNELTVHKDGSLIFQIHLTKEFKQIIKHEIRDYRSLNFLTNGDHLYAANRGIDSNDLVISDSESWELHLTDGDQSKFSYSLPEPVREMCWSPDSVLWCLSSNQGVFLFDAELNPLYNGQKLFTEYLISAIHFDHEGNALFGTKDHGLMQLVNPDLVEFPAFAGNRNAFKVCTATPYGIFAGTAQGWVYRIDHRLSPELVIKTSAQITSLHHLEGSNRLLINNHNRRTVLLNLEDNTTEELIVSAVKNVNRIGDGEYLLSTIMGAMFFGLDDQQIKMKQYGKVLNGNIIIGPPLRTHSAGYDPQTGQILLGSSHDMMGYLPNDQGTVIRYRDQRLVVRDMVQHEGKHLLGTQKHGVLFYEAGKFTDSISVLSGLSSNDIRQMVLDGNNLYVATAEGFHMIDLTTREVSTLGPSEGLNTIHVSNFAIGFQHVWLQTPKKFYALPLSSLRPHPPVPRMRFSGITVNNKCIDPQTTSSFRYDENRFMFDVSCITLRYRKEMKFRYRLTGLDENWQYRDFDANNIAFKSLPSGNYSLLVVPLYRGQTGEALTYNFSISAPFWQTWWFVVLIVLVFLTGSFFIYKVYLNRQLRMAHQINELNASKLTAIRSQMNPHFIFNALNSIQDLVLKGDVEQSYTYITRFSNLIRRTLNYSDQNFIEFSQELKLLELYLSLEKLRFNKEFEYEMVYEEEEDLRIPPMLIQPFIENALVHGLLHKEGLCKLSIRFERKDHLLCIIEDNGVGRAEAKEIRQRQRSDHESFSSKAIARRFKILKQHFKGEFGFTYEDLHENGKPSGTRVTLRIPIQKKF